MRSESKAFTAVFSFLLGFLFAIIAEIAAIAAVAYFILNSELKDIFNAVGFSNVDENGNKYINTDEILTVRDLVDKMSALTDFSVTSVATVENLFPAVSPLVNDLYGKLGELADFDEEELNQTPFIDIVGKVGDIAMAIRPAKLLENFDIDMSQQNIMVKALLGTKECDYVYTEAGEKYPVFFDEYIPHDLDVMVKYYRYSGNTKEGDGEDKAKGAGQESDAYPDNILNPEEWLVDSGASDENYNRKYRQYFYPVVIDGHTYYFITKPVDGKYYYNAEAVASLDAKYMYNESYGENFHYSTGSLYYDADGVKHDVRPVTVKSMSEDVLAPLKQLSVVDMLGDDELVKEVFSTTLIGDLIGGNYRFTEVVNDVELPTLMKISSDSSIMCYLAYRISRMKVFVPDDDYTYSPENVFTHTGIYHKDGVEIPCYINAPRTIIDSAYYFEGEGENRKKVEITGTKVMDVGITIDGFIHDMTLGDILEFGDEEEDSNSILDSLKDTKISDMNQKIRDLTLGEIVEINEDNKVLYHLRNTRLFDIASAIADLSVQQIYSDGIYAGEGETAELKRVVTSAEDVAEGTVLYDPNYIYYVEEDGDYNLVRIQNGDVVYGLGEIAEQSLMDADVTYYTYGAPVGTWKFLLCKRIKDDLNDTVEYKEKSYTVNDFADMIDNAAKNIGSATLCELADADIISKESVYKTEIVDGQEVVNKKVLRIPYLDENNQPASYEIIVGDNSITEFIDKIASLSS